MTTSNARRQNEPETDQGVKLTSRGRYAVMAMVELARKKGDKPIPLSEIAQKSDISLSYLEQLFAGLRRKGLVRSYRGPGGGYVLAMPTSDIRVSSILEAAEDSVPGRKSRSAGGGEKGETRETESLWNQIGRITMAVMAHVTLEDVMEERLDRHARINKVIDTLSEGLV